MSATIHAGAGPAGITALPGGWSSESACAAGMLKVAASRTVIDARRLRSSSDERLSEEPKADERLSEEPKADERLSEEPKADEGLREERKAMGGEPSRGRRSCSIDPC